MAQKKMVSARSDHPRVTLGARQRIGLEPWGRMKVTYQGLEPELPTILEVG